jgi:hypothetical protein
LATVAIYPSLFHHSGVAKAYESCRNFVGTTVVIEATADGFLRLRAGGLRLPNGAMLFVTIAKAKVVHKSRKSDFLSLECSAPPRFLEITS